MNTERERRGSKELYLQVHQAVQRQVDAQRMEHGSEAVAEANAHLSNLLRDNPAARREYQNYMQDVVSLQWFASGRCHLQDDEFLTSDSRSLVQRMLGGAAIGRSWLLLALAASMLLSLSAGAIFFLSTERREVAFSAKPPASQTLASQAAASQANASQANGASSDQAMSPQIATSQTTSREEVAIVSELIDVSWQATSLAPQILSRIAVGDRLDLADGSLVLTFDRGVQVHVFGPAELEITSSTSIFCQRGRATALVGENAKGFTINTPQAEVVDLGTQFGVNISDRHDTEVVVFDGVVDLTPKGASQAQRQSKQLPATAKTRRMLQGDGLLVNGLGEMHRLMAVQRGDFIRSAAFPDFLPRKPTPLIEDVRDNRRGNESSKCYQIVHGAFGEDAPSFVDRHHQWNGIDEQGIPEFLLGADYIMPFNDDKFVPDLQVEVQISRPSVCYLFLDNNMTPPKWLVEAFEDTGVDIGLDGAKSKWNPENRLAVGPGKSIDFVFSVWRREITRSGRIVLGSVEPPRREDRGRGFSMYGIAVAPAKSALGRATK